MGIYNDIASIKSSVYSLQDSVNNLSRCGGGGISSFEMEDILKEHRREIRKEMDKQRYHFDSKFNKLNEKVDSFCLNINNKLDNILSYIENEEWEENVKQRYNIVKKHCPSLPYYVFYEHLIKFEKNEPYLNPLDTDFLINFFSICYK